MTGTAKTTEPRRQWSVRSFEAFWSSPEPSRVPASLTEDIVGHWAGREEPARGRAEYTGCIAALVDALPDVRVSVAEHAQSGEFTFIRWIMRATARTAHSRSAASTVSGSATAGSPRTSSSSTQRRSRTARADPCPGHSRSDARPP